jgi:hypothetical protein
MPLLRVPPPLGSASSDSASRGLGVGLPHESAGRVAAYQPAATHAARKISSADV